MAKAKAAKKISKAKSKVTHPAARNFEPAQARPKGPDDTVANYIADMKGEPPAPVHVGPVSALNSGAKVMTDKGMKKVTLVKAEKLSLHLEGVVMVEGVLEMLGAAPKAHLDTAVRFDKIRIGTFFVDVKGKKVGRVWLKSGNTSGLHMTRVDITPRPPQLFAKSIPDAYGKKERFGKKASVIPLSFEVALSRPQFNTVGAGPRTAGVMSG